MSSRLYVESLEARQLMTVSQEDFIPASRQDTNDGAAVDAFFQFCGDDASYLKMAMSDLLATS